MIDADSMIRLRQRARRMLAVVLAGTTLVGHASGCGLEGDPVTLQMVAMGYAYPDSLNVMATVSQARLAGKLDRTISIGVQTPEQLRRASLRIGAALWQMRARLARGAPGDAPSLAIVLIEPMMWSRISTAKGAPELTIHVNGPATGDVVVVTEAVVIAAINEGTLTTGEALSAGLIRFYGADNEVASTRAWLLASDSVNPGSGT